MLFIGVIFGGTMRSFNIHNYNLPIDQCIFIASVNKGQEYTDECVVSQYIDTYTIPDEWYFVDKSKKWLNYNTCSMFYHNYKAYNLLMEQNKELNVVIKLRSDCTINSNVKDVINKYFPLEENTIYVPTSWWYGEYGGMNDQIAFGTVNSMQIYCNVYNNIYEYINKQNVVFHPESLLKYHLIKNNISIVQIELHYSKFQTKYDD